jgi:3-hydroxybutyryl-CoA dehydrogenase
MMQIKKIGVIGLGIMGSGIAQVSVEAGYETLGLEINIDYLNKGIRIIEDSLNRGVAKGKYEKSYKDEVTRRLKGTTEINELKDCDLIIEAINENLGLKRELFGRLDRVCKGETIFATNTSSFSIAELASCTTRHENFVGMHFFNPVQMMKLLEIVQSIVVSKESIDAVFHFARSIKKEPILVKDYQGFVVNILLAPYFVEAVRLLEQGIAGVLDIDQAMKLGCGYPMGPFTLLDMAGLDTLTSALDSLYEAYKDKKYAAPSLMKKMVQLGYLGRKSGKGFYDYSKNPPEPTNLNI